MTKPMEKLSTADLTRLTVKARTVPIPLGMELHVTAVTKFEMPEVEMLADSFEVLRIAATMYVNGNVHGQVSETTSLMLNRINPEAADELVVGVAKHCILAVLSSVAETVMESA